MLLLKFWIMKFNSYTLDDSGEAVVETGGQPSSGKTSFTIMLTKFGQNLENLMKPLGIFSCLMQTWHVNWKYQELNHEKILSKSFFNICTYKLKVSNWIKRVFTELTINEKS